MAEAKGVNYWLTPKHQFPTAEIKPQFPHKPFQLCLRVTKSSGVQYSISVIPATQEEAAETSGIHSQSELHEILSQENEK